MLVDLFFIVIRVPDPNEDCRKIVLYLQYDILGHLVRRCYDHSSHLHWEPLTQRVEEGDTESARGRNKRKDTREEEEGKQ